MSERKLYFPGLGGNRYEISLEELQKQAYKGKIKRDDKIIVVKIKRGQTTEIETTCGKIRVVAESFNQGEADRKAEADRKHEENERKLAEKKAKEAALYARAKEKEADIAQRQAQRQIQKAMVKNEISALSREPLFKAARLAVYRAAAAVAIVVVLAAWHFGAKSSLTRGSLIDKDIDLNDIAVNFMFHVEYFIDHFLGLCFIGGAVFLTTKLVLDVFLYIALYRTKTSSKGLDEAINPASFPLQDSTTETVPVPPREF